MKRIFPVITTSFAVAALALSSEAYAGGGEMAVSIETCPGPPACALPFVYTVPSCTYGLVASPTYIYSSAPATVYATTTPVVPAYAVVPVQPEPMPGPCGPGWGPPACRYREGPWLVRPD
jgi:hypothetical protein